MKSESSQRVHGLENGVQGYDHVVVLERRDSLPRNLDSEAIERARGFAVYSGGDRIGNRWFFVRARPVALALAVSLRQATFFSVMGIFAATHEVKFDSALGREVFTLTIDDDVTRELLDDRELLHAFADGQQRQRVHWKG
jgi:hypothetical protein